MIIGERIKDQFEKSGMKLSDFASRIGTVRQNVYRLFERSSIDADLLLEISKVLNHDFFQYYRLNDSDLTVDVLSGEIKDNELAVLRDQLESAQKEIEYLKQIVHLREEEKRLIESKHKMQQELLETIITNLRQKEKNYQAQIKKMQEGN